MKRPAAAPHVPHSELNKDFDLDDAPATPVPEDVAMGSGEGGQEEEDAAPEPEVKCKRRKRGDRTDEEKAVDASLPELAKFYATCLAD